MGRASTHERSSAQWAQSHGLLHQLCPWVLEEWASRPQGSHSQSSAGLDASPSATATAILLAPRPRPRPQEYLPVAHAVAYNELLVLHRLLGGLPQDTYEVRPAGSP